MLTNLSTFFILRFRHQHEQLRVVIIRVLKPVGTASSNIEVAKVHDNTVPGTDAVDTDDSDAILEVNLAYESVKEIDCLDVSKEGNDNWEAAIVRLINYYLIVIVNQIFLL